MRSEEKEKTALRSGLPRRKQDSQLPETEKNPSPFFPLRMDFGGEISLVLGRWGSWVVTVPPAQGRR